MNDAVRSSATATEFLATDGNPVLQGGEDVIFSWADAGVAGAPGWTRENTRLEWQEAGLVMHHPHGALLFPTNDTGVPGGPLKREVLAGFIEACSGVFVCAFDQAGTPLASMGFAATLPASAT